MTALVGVERRKAIGVITLDDPATMNALSDPLLRELLEALRSLDCDASIRCAVLTGAGRGFCSGGSLKEMVDGAGLFAGSPHEVRRSFSEGVQQLPRLIHDMEMPVVAAVNGAAYGAGLDLAAMCDIRVAGRSARFAESFARIGLVAGDGGAWFLPRLIGLGRAMEMTLTGEPVDAPTAQSFGLVNHVVDDAELMAAALGIAGRIAAQPREATRLSRKLLRQSLDLSLADSLGVAASMQAVAVGSDEQREALARFLEARRSR